jgi:hypothetical protein
MCTFIHSLNGERRDGVQVRKEIVGRRKPKESDEDKKEIISQ